MKKKYSLSILIPVFNEEATIEQVVNAVKQEDLSPWETEIIIIDDGSTDRTASRIKTLLPKLKQVRVITQKSNNGKGAAVRIGIGKATGDFILIQDADLEYSPKDIPRLLRLIQEEKAQVVYGTRLNRWPNLLRDERTPRFLLHYLGNRMLSALAGALYGQRLTDLETGYKVFPRKAVQQFSLTARGFEFEPEITIQLIKAGFRIHEVPIRTNPRGYKNGKKLRTIPDGIKALKMILLHR